MYNIIFVNFKDFYYRKMYNKIFKNEINLMREKMTVQEEKIYELNQIVKMREGKKSIDMK